MTTLESDVHNQGEGILTKSPKKGGQLVGTSKHSSIRVLVVDDDAEQRTMITQVVAAHGFCSQSASDGAEALQLHQRTPADVIVTDLMMPTMDGFELLRNLEANGDRTPTIVLTGFGSIEKAISIVHDLRAFWFLEKPIQARILCTLLERAVMQKRLLDETRLLSRQLSHQRNAG